MTKQEAIKNHRKMWNWIADQIEKTGKMVSKNDYFDHIGMPVKERPSIDCFCCEYAKMTHKIHQPGLINCNLCPVKWPNENIIMKPQICYCVEGDNLYLEYYYICYKYINTVLEKPNYERAVELARQIANLPEREEE